MPTRNNKVCTGKSVTIVVVQKNGLQQDCCSLFYDLGGRRKAEEKK